MLTYATADDLVGFDSHVDVDERDVTRFLRVASGLVAWAIRADIYDAAPSGLPTEPELLEALRDATCAQVAHWATNGIDPGTVKTTQPERKVKTKTEGPRSITYTDDSAGVEANRAAAAGELCQDAELILRAAGFLTGQPWTY